MPTCKHRGRGRKFNDLISFTQRNQRKNGNWDKATKPQSPYNDVLTPVRLCLPKTPQPLQTEPPTWTKYSNM